MGVIEWMVLNRRLDRDLLFEGAITSPWIEKASYIQRSCSLQVLPVLEVRERPLRLLLDAVIGRAAVVRRGRWGTFSEIEEDY